MAQQTIDVGTAPNSGTGNPLRTAFIRCNDNFTELYNILPTPPAKLTQSGATTNQVLTWNGSNWVPSSVPVPSTSRTVSFQLDSVFSTTINDGGSTWPAGQSAPVFVIPFNPTNFLLSYYNVNSDASPGQAVGMGFDYSISSTTGFTSHGTYLPMRSDTVNAFVSAAGTLTVGGSPSAIYIRPRWINTTGNTRTLAGNCVVFTFWN